MGAWRNTTQVYRVGRLHNYDKKKSVNYVIPFCLSKEKDKERERKKKKKGNFITDKKVD